MADDMKSDDPSVFSVAASQGSFGAMSRDQLLELHRNPPKLASIGDPFANRPKSSQVQASQQLRSNLELAAAGLPYANNAAPIRVLASGVRAYHRKHKEECTVVAASTEKPGVVVVRWDDGSTNRVNVDNLTAL